MAPVYRQSRLYGATTLRERVQRRVDRESVVELEWDDIVAMSDLAIASTSGPTEHKHVAAALRWLHKLGALSPRPERKARGPRRLTMPR